MISLVYPISINELVEWYNYARPIVSACSGFTKTDGFMVWEANGTLSILSNDKGWLYVVTGLRPTPVNLACNVIKFARTKDDPNNLINNTNTLGDNIISREVLNFKNKYSPYILNQIESIFETDMFEMDGFDDAIQRKASQSIPSLKFCDKYGRNMVYASKSITPLNKGDTAKLYIYDDVSGFDNVSVFKQVVHKKKYNININIISRQMRMIQ